MKNIIQIQESEYPNTQNRQVAEYQYLAIFVWLKFPTFSRVINNLSLRFEFDGYGHFRSYRYVILLTSKDAFS